MAWNDSQFDWWFRDGLKQFIDTNRKNLDNPGPGVDLSILTGDSQASFAGDMKFDPSQVDHDDLRINDVNGDPSNFPNAQGQEGQPYSDDFGRGPNDPPPVSGG